MKIEERGMSIVLTPHTSGEYHRCLRIVKAIWQEEKELASRSMSKVIVTIL